MKNCLLNVGKFAACGSCPAFDSWPGSNGGSKTTPFGSVQAKLLSLQDWNVGASSHSEQLCVNNLRNPQWVKQAFEEETSRNGGVSCSQAGGNMCYVKEKDVGAGIFGESELQYLCQTGRLSEVMDVLERGGVSASKRLYSQFMSKCGEMKLMSEAKRMHIHLSERRLDVDNYVGGGIVEMYVKCGSVSDAWKAHERLPRGNEFSWTALISGSGNPAEAIRMYKQMRDDGVKATVYTFLAALKACSISADLENGKLIHAHIRESGNESDMFLSTTLLDMYAKCGSMTDARQVFDRLPYCDVVSWNAMILGCARQEEGEVALELYTQMQHEGIASNSRTFVGVLKACGSLAALEEDTEVDGRVMKVGCLEKGRDIHTQVIKCGFECNVFVGTTLVDMYAKCGSMADARRVFERLPHRTLVSWNVMISGYVEEGEAEAAFQLYAQMREHGLSANVVTFVSILKACADTVALETGRYIHEQICVARLETTGMIVATALVDMYGKCGSMVDAQQVFDACPSRSVVIWNALIGGYARQGETNLVFHWFERMNQEGIRPNELTFLGLLTVCSHAGLVEKGHECFDAMTKEYDLVPTIEHYSAMVDLLGRAGQMDEAMTMMETMPFQPDLVMWRIMLGACQKWNNVEVGRHAFEHAVQLDITNAAAYVLMSNIYADAHMWHHRDNIQEMKESGRAWKQPGKSWWTELGGTVHTFVVGDTKHPRTKEIYAKLKDLSIKMKEQVYLSNLEYANLKK